MTLRKRIISYSTSFTAMKSARSPSLAETFTMDKFQTLQGLPLFFRKQFKDFYSFLKFERLFEADACRNPAIRVPIYLQGIYVLSCV